MTRPEPRSRSAESSSARHSRRNCVLGPDSCRPWSSRSSKQKTGIDALVPVERRAQRGMVADPKIATKPDDAGPASGHGANLPRAARQGPSLVRIDPENEEISETIEAPKLPSGGDVIEVGNSVWATAYNDGALVELQTEPEG